MSKVIYEFHIKKYTVLKLDEMPKKSYHKFLIDGNEYKSVPIYDVKIILLLKVIKVLLENLFRLFNLK